MQLKDLRCESENVSFQDYYELYNNVRNNMKKPEWLGFIPQNEVEIMLENNGKIWLYYDGNIPVCSMIYITVENKLLEEHNVNVKDTETGTLGPIMVRKEYQGKGFMRQMLEKFDLYNKSINNKYIFVKAAKDNIYSVRNIKEAGYQVVDEYKNERGLNLAFLKVL